MASIGKINYYSTLAPATDGGFGYPIMQAPADKAVKLTSLAFFNVSNTAVVGILYSIIPAATSILADDSYELANQVSFPQGLLASNSLNSTIINPSTSIGNIRITAHTEILIPAGALLVGHPDPNGNLNGTIQYQAIGYECETGY